MSLPIDKIKVLLHVWTISSFYSGPKKIRGVPEIKHDLEPWKTF